MKKDALTYPFRGDPPSNTEPNPTPGSMENLRRQNPPSRLSQVASSIMQQSKAEGMRKHNLSFWKSFSSWGNRGEVDPISFPIEKVASLVNPY